MRATVTQSSGVSEGSMRKFLAQQPELRGRCFQVVLEAAEVKAGVSAGHLFFRLDVPDATTPGPGGLYVLRYDVGEGRLFLQTSLRQQFDVMRALRSEGLPTPEAPWFDEDGVIVPEAKALIMRRIEARPPHLMYMENGPYIEASKEMRRTMLGSLMGFCVRLHSLPVAKLDLPFLAVRGGSGQHFIDREINWTLYELRSRPSAIEEGERGAFLSRMRATCHAAADWLRARAPRDAAPVLVHGDVTLANVMFNDDGTVAAVLDWELCHEGLAGEDVAWPALAPRCAANFYGASTAEMPTLDDMRAAYLACGGRLEHLDYAAVLTAFRLVSISALAMSLMPPEFWATQAKDWIAQKALLDEQIERFDKSVGSA